MRIEDALDMNIMLDLYEELLTDRQKEVMKLYYEEDFSLSEIAENLKVSRAAVSDLLKRTSKLLADYEQKLKLVKKYQKRTQIYDKIKALNNPEVNIYIAELESYE